MAPRSAPKIAPKSIPDLVAYLAGSDTVRAVEAESELCRVIGEFRDIQADQLDAPRGGNARAVADRLGHSSPAITLAIYTHTLQPQADALTKAAEAALFGAPKR